MKRSFLILIVMTFILCGCASTPPENVPATSSDITTKADITTTAEIPVEDADFGFSYKVVSERVEKGERIQISVELTNQQGKSYSWEGPYSAFRADVTLVCVIGDDSFIISPEPIADTDDIGSYEIAAGGKRSADFYFTIPANAPLGSYSLICSFRGTKREFVNVFELDR